MFGSPISLNTLTQLSKVPLLLCPQAYTSQFISLVMFGLMMSEDRISLQNRRQEIIRGLRSLPGESQNVAFFIFKSIELLWVILFLLSM